jgi:hypothetical protein
MGTAFVLIGIFMLIYFNLILYSMEPAWIGFNIGISCVIIFFGIISIYMWKTYDKHPSSKSKNNLFFQLIVMILHVITIIFINSSYFFVIVKYAR